MGQKITSASVITTRNSLHTFNSMINIIFGDPQLSKDTVTSELSSLKNIKRQLVRVRSLTKWKNSRLMKLMRVSLVKLIRPHSSRDKSKLWSESAALPPEDQSECTLLHFKATAKDVRHQSARTMAKNNVAMFNRGLHQSTKPSSPTKIGTYSYLKDHIKEQQEHCLNNTTSNELRCQGIRC